MSTFEPLGRAVRASFLLASCFFLAGLAGAAGKPPQQASELEIVHHLNPSKAAQLQRLVDAYNASGPAQRVVLSERDWSQGKLPAMLLLGDAEQERFLTGKPRYRSLYRVMAGAGLALKTFKPQAFVTPTPIDSRGRLLALPVALATPVMYLNKQALREIGAESEPVPETWDDLQNLLGRLMDAGFACPYTSADPDWILIDNTSAWHNEPTVRMNGKKETLATNGMLQVKHIAKMASWYRARYLQLFDAEGEAERRFASGECAVLTASSAAYAEFRDKTGFEVAVARLPYHEGYPGAPQNTLADGASLWVAEGLNKQDYLGVARLVSYWLSPEAQVGWQRDSGYLPLNRAGLLASDSELLQPEMASIKVAVSQLTNRPVTASSRASAYPGSVAVRKILSEELHDVWADSKAAKQALDNAVVRSRGRCDGC